MKRFTLEGEIFYEVIEVDGKKYEHAGFRDKEGKFGQLLFSLVSPERPRVKARITIEVLE